jgi:spermidine synthase
MMESSFRLSFKVPRTIAEMLWKSSLKLPFKSLDALQQKEKKKIKECNIYLAGSHDWIADMPTESIVKLNFNKDVSMLTR